MTDNPDDMRRAKAIVYAEGKKLGMTDAFARLHAKRRWKQALPLLAIIDASDEAAGMVLVPRVATQAMCMEWVRKFDNAMGPQKMWGMMIAAHEGGDGE